MTESDDTPGTAVSQGVLAVSEGAPAEASAAGRRRGNDLAGLSDVLPRSLEGRRVMVAEDNVILSMHVASALEDAGAEVFGPYPFAEEALNRLAGGPPPDAAVLDYELMGGTSAPVAAQLARMGVPFAFFTSHAAAVVEADDAVTPILAKPNEARTLVQAVEALLREPCPA